MPARNAKKGKRPPKRGGAAPKRTADGGRAASAGSQARELIDMHEAIKLLKTTRPTFYRWLRAGRIKGMKLGRQWRFYREDVERFLKGEAPRVDLPADISPLIKTLRGRAREIGVKCSSEKDASPVRQAVDLMILVGVGSRASDIHITAHLPEDSGQSVAVLRYRIDGVLHEIATIDVRLLPAIVEEWKRMAACDVHEKAKPQDGRILTDFSEFADKPGKLIDVRVCFLPAGLGESVTARILDASAVRLSLDRIEYNPQDREKLLRAIKRPWGVILMSGPTGSGKTSVLYACLNEVAGPEVKTMTIEDPIEFLLPWVTQTAVNHSAGVTFARALRSILRSDPDVVLVAEIRDRETLLVAQQCALTGHLVMSTLHADDAAGALRRMADVGSPPFLVAESTKLIASQRLIRKLCPHCSREGTPAADRLELAAGAARNGGVDWDSLDLKFRKSVGCEKCSGTGFRGRNVIAEMLEMTPEIGKALRNNASVEELRSIAVEQGMTTMAADGVRKAANGETTLDEVLRVVR